MTMLHFASTSCLFLLQAALLLGQQALATIGTPRLLHDINPGPNSSDLSPRVGLIESKNILYILANDGTRGEELWKIRASSGQVSGAADINKLENPRTGDTSSNPNNLRVVHDVLYFDAYVGAFGRVAPFWMDDSDDGTSSTARPLWNLQNDSHPNIDMIGDFTALGDDVCYLVKNNGDVNFSILRNEIWCTNNGSVDGTYVAYNASENRDLDIVGSSANHIYFTSRNFLDNNVGITLWRTNGKDDAEVVAPLISTRPVTTLQDVQPFVKNEAGDKAFFSVRVNRTHIDLWAVDLSDDDMDGANVTRLFYPGFTNPLIRSSVFNWFNDTNFLLNDGGEWLWTSDLTTEGTKPFVQWQPGKTDVAFSGGSFHSSDGQSIAHLTIRNVTTREIQEQWVTDLTVNGTKLIFDKPTPIQSYDPVMLSDGRVVFFVHSSTNATHAELWAVDALAENEDYSQLLGTYQLPHEDGSRPGINDCERFGTTMTGLNDTAFIFKGYDEDHGCEPWVVSYTPIRSGKVGSGNDDNEAPAAEDLGSASASAGRFGCFPPAWIQAITGLLALCRFVYYV